MPFADRPLEVKMLEEYISDWRNLDGGILLIPKRGLHFNQLFLRSRWFFMDRVFDFSAIIRVISKRRMNEGYRPLHNSLAELSCELHWSGLIRKRPHFRSYALLDIIQDRVPAISPNSELIDALSSSDTVMEMLRRVSPDRLYITLSSFTTPQLSPTRHRDVLIKMLIDRYQNPEEITWVISMSKLISRTLSYKRKFIEAVGLIESISKVVMGVTYRIKNRLKRRSKK